MFLIVVGLTHLLTRLSSYPNFTLIVIIMRPSTTIALISVISLLDFSFGHPLSHFSTGQGIHDATHQASGPHDVADAQVPPAQAVAMIPTPVHSNEPLPRRLSRRTDGYLPTGHRPSDLGADNSMIPGNGISTIPKQRSLQLAERKDLPIMKRHDHINSPEAVTAASCNGELVLLFFVIN